MERYLDRIKKTESCWLWTGTKQHQGYGVIVQNGKQLKAHRVIYESLRGNIPDGLTIDHLCRIKNCVNPTHLEPVTLRENILRAMPYRRGRYKCKRNHLMIEGNLYYSNGIRRCKTCMKMHQRKHRGKLRTRTL